MEIRPNLWAPETSKTLFQINNEIASWLYSDIFFLQLGDAIAIHRLQKGFVKGKSLYIHKAREAFPGHSLNSSKKKDSFK